MSASQRPMPVSQTTLDHPRMQMLCVSRLCCAYLKDLTDRFSGTRWDVSLENGHISRIRQHDTATIPDGASDRKGALLAPSFCHPHIHIDKAYLLSHPKYASMRLQKGGFEEAMSLTGQAKVSKILRCTSDSRSIGESRPNGFRSYLHPTLSLQQH